MPARFEVRDSNDGQFYAVSRAANGQVAWVTETYRNKQDAINACYLIKRKAPVAEVYDHTASARR